CYNVIMTSPLPNFNEVKEEMEGFVMQRKHKKFKSKTIKSLLSFCLAVVLALQTVIAAVVSAAGETGEDKTGVFMGANAVFPLEVKQGGAVIDPGGTILGRQQFTLKSE